MTASLRVGDCQKEMSFTSLYWCSVSVLAHLTNDMARVRVWLSRSLSLRGHNEPWEGGEGGGVMNGWMLDGKKETRRGGERYKEGREEEKKGRKKGCQYIRFLSILDPLTDC